MKVEVLISCMHQKDTSIIKKCNVRSDVVIVNQCDINKVDEFDFKDNSGVIHHAKFIYTTERGLSKSRNLAIKNSSGDICKICDDDEVLSNNYVEAILAAYRKFSKASVILFNYYGKNDRKFKTKKVLFSFFLLKATSRTITFRRKDIMMRCFLFDTKMGSGTGNGGGEENKFLFECKRAKLRIYTSSDYITTLYESGQSFWFKGYDKDYYINLGWISKRLLGPFYALLYIFYLSFHHYSLYKKELSPLNALKSMLYGYFIIKR